MDLEVLRHERPSCPTPGVRIRRAARRPLPSRPSGPKGCDEGCDEACDDGTETREPGRVRAGVAAVPGHAVPVGVLRRARAGSISADYTGARLATGADPQVEIPKGLEDIADELLDVLDPGVRVLALVVALLLVAGVVLPFVPRLGHELRHRMFGGAALAVLAGALMVVTQVVAQANLTDRLTDYAEKLSQNEPVPNIDRIDELIHAEVGYWLSLVGLILIAGLSVGTVFKDKISPAARSSPTRPLPGPHRSGGPSRRSRPSRRHPRPPSRPHRSAPGRRPNHPRPPAPKDRPSRRRRPNGRASRRLDLHLAGGCTLDPLPARRSEDPMRAVWLTEFGGPEALVARDTPDPQAGPGQALVDVAYASITFVETQFRATGGGPVTAEPPVIPGNGVGGVVAAVGDGVDPALVGTRVVSATGGSGGYASRVAVDAAGVYPVPAGLALDAATALLADGRTATLLMRTAEPKPGERVLVEAAAGGVGSLLVQLAKAAGAHVVAAAGGARKLDLARELGADEVVGLPRAGLAGACRGEWTSCSTGSAGTSAAPRSGCSPAAAGC